MSCQFENVLYSTFHSKGPSRSEDQVWLALELCSGGSVTDLLESMRKKSQAQSLTEEEIAYILSEVTNALVYLHGHCRIHRDIKGNNILLTEEGKRKVLNRFVLILFVYIYKTSTRDYALPTDS